MNASPTPRSIGKIVQVHGPVVEIQCTELPPIRQALSAAGRQGQFVFEVYQHLNDTHIRAIALNRALKISRWPNNSFDLGLSATGWHGTHRGVLWFFSIKHGNSNT